MRDVLRVAGRHLIYLGPLRAAGYVFRHWRDWIR